MVESRHSPEYVRTARKLTSETLNNFGSHRTERPNEKLSEGACADEGHEADSGEVRCVIVQVVGSGTAICHYGSFVA